MDPVPRFLCLLAAGVLFAFAALGGGARPWRTASASPVYESRLMAAGLLALTLPWLWDAAEVAFR